MKHVSHYLRRLFPEKEEDRKIRLKAEAIVAESISEICEVPSLFSMSQLLKLNMPELPDEKRMNLARTIYFSDERREARRRLKCQAKIKN